MWRLLPLLLGLLVADVNPIVVGGGIAAGAPFGLNHLVYVTNVNPPQLSSFAATIATDTLSAVPYLNVPNSAGASVTTNKNALEQLRVNGGMIVEGTGAVDSTVIGRGALATVGVLDQIVIGRGAFTTGSNGRGQVVIGATSNGSGAASVIVGFNSGSGSAAAVAGVFIGAVAQAAGTGGNNNVVCIGDNALIVLGNGGTAGGVAVGFSATIASPGCVVIGYSAQSLLSSNAGQAVVVIGDSANANKGGTTVVGGSSQANGTNASVFGSSSNANATGSTTVGAASLNSGVDTILIGRGGTLASNQQIAIGAAAVDIGVNVAQLGTPGTPINTFVLGAGDTIVSPAARTMRFTNASGIDNAAGGLTIQSPLSTGAAAPATISFQLGAAGATGAGLQTTFVGFRLDADTTANNIRALVWDVTAAALVRMSRGAADSGGTGFRLLRVPN